MTPAEKEDFLADKDDLLKLSKDALVLKIQQLRQMLEAADTRVIEAESWRNLVACEVDGYATFADIPRLIRELKARAEAKS